MSSFQRQHSHFPPQTHTLTQLWTVVRKPERVIWQTNKQQKVIMKYNFRRTQTNNEKVRNERRYCGFHREQVKCLCWAMWSHMTAFNIYQEMISLGWHESRTRSVNEHIWLWGGSLNQGFEILKCLEWGKLLIFTWNDDFRVTNTKRLFRRDCVCSWKSR